MKYARIIYKNGDSIGATCFFIKEIATTFKQRRAIFKCKCGKEFEAAICNVISGQVKSCGCAFLDSWVTRKKEIKIVLCACGCNEKLIGVSEYGRTREYIHGHNKSNLGNTHTQAALIKMSVALTGKPSKKFGVPNPAFKGKNNPNWKGGVTPINEQVRKSIDYKIWRKAVFERDNYTCQCCGEKEKVSGKLEADHIKPLAYFPELRFAIDNGRTLCRECHKKTDTYLVKAKQKYGT